MVKAKKIKRSKKTRKPVIHFRQYSFVENLSIGVAVFGVFGGILFLSPSLTGYVVSNSSTINVTNLIGAALLLIGAFAALFFLSKRRK